MSVAIDKASFTPVFGRNGISTYLVKCFVRVSFIKRLLES